MNFLLKNFLALLFVIFLFAALGQWNHPNFQQKAYIQAKEMITADLAAKGEKSGNFLEPPELSVDLIQVGVVTKDGAEYLYDIGIQNPIWIQLSALNLIVPPKVEITGFIKSEP